MNEMNNKFIDFINKTPNAFCCISNKNLTLILIDFFHLALPSDLYFKNGDVKKMKLDSCYNKVSTYKWDIKNIL